MGSVLKDAVISASSAGDPVGLRVRVSPALGGPDGAPGFAFLLTHFGHLQQLGIDLERDRQPGRSGDRFPVALTLLAGVLLPLSLGPKWLQIIAYVNPMYYVVEAARVLRRHVGRRQGLGSLCCDDPADGHRSGLVDERLPQGRRLIGLPTTVPSP